MANNLTHVSMEDRLEDILLPKEVSKIENRNKKMLKKNLKHGENVVEFKRQERDITVEPLTEKQKALISAVYTSPQVMTYGCAGTGKTYVPATIAADLLRRGQIQKIVITRPNVPVGESIGFFPGDLNDKMGPWVAPVVEVLVEHFGRSAVENMVSNKKIEFVPFEVIRGRSFENAFVFLDEAQNCSYDEIKAFITRIGRGCKVVVDGDVSQTDIGHRTGFRQILDMALTYPGLKEFITVVEFDSDDVVRSGETAEWIKAFEVEESPAS